MRPSTRRFGIVLPLVLAGCATAPNRADECLAEIAQRQARFPVPKDMKSLEPYRAKVLATVISRREDLRTCGKESNNSILPVSGAITIGFLIAPNGKVDHACVAGSSVPRILETCVREIVSTLDFPPPPAGAAVSVHFPFGFQPAR